MDNDNNKKHEAIYNKIIGFYDFAEELVDTVENPKVKDPISQLEFVEPLVKQIEDSTDVLAEEYREFIKTGKKPGFLVRRKIAKSLKSIYAALGECKRASKEG